MMTFVHESATRWCRDGGTGLLGGLDFGVRGLSALMGGSGSDVFHGRRRPIVDGDDTMVLLVRE